MALVKCGCCGREISPAADPCPQCGDPRMKRAGAWLGVGKWLAIAGLIGVAVQAGDAAGLFLVIGCLVALVALYTRGF